jgi:hypothetical protein
MKKLLITMMLFALMSLGVTQAAVVKKIAGLKSECDTTNIGCQPIPLTFSAVCTVSCPQVIMPSFTDANRMWGRTSTGVGSCTTSIDGGATWNACATQPFVGGVWQGREMYMGTADGGVVVLSFESTPTCQIRKSTDNAVTWQTKFTDSGANTRCAGTLFESATGWCLADGRCEFQSYHSSNVPAYRVYRSTDNGENWTKGSDTGVDTTNNPAGSIWDGSVGMMALTQTTISGAPYSSPTGDTWSEGTATATSYGDCWGQVILSSTAYSVCADNTVYTLRNRLGTLFKTPTFPATPVMVFSVDSGGVSYAYDSSTIYTLVSLVSPAHTGLYVSRNAGTSYTFLADVSTTGVRGGTMWKHPLNGCVYWVAGGVLRIGKVCI